MRTYLPLLHFSQVHYVFNTEMEDGLGEQKTDEVADREGAGITIDIGPKSKEEGSKVQHAGLQQIKEGEAV